MGPDASRGVAKGTHVVGGCYGVDLNLNYFLGLALSRCRSIIRVPAFGVRDIKSRPRGIAIDVKQHSRSLVKK